MIGGAAEAQDFTSRALPPETLAFSTSGPQPHLDGGVFVVQKGFEAVSRRDEVSPQRRSAPVLESNVRCIAQAIYHEARGETLAGQKAVADVVMNRVRSGKWSSDACGVIHAPGQFQGSSRWPTPRPGEPLWDRAIAIARSAASGVVGVSSRLMSFRAGFSHPGMRIGHQVFF